MTKGLMGWDNTLYGISYHLLLTDSRDLNPKREVHDVKGCGLAILTGQKNSNWGLNSARRLNIKGVPKLGRTVCARESAPMCFKKKIRVRLVVHCGTRGVGWGVLNGSSSANNFFDFIIFISECAELLKPTLVMYWFRGNECWGLMGWDKFTLVLIEKCKRVEGDVVTNVLLSSSST